MLDAAEGEACKTHGKRPAWWIWWRNCDVFYEDHLDCRREEFLKQPGADPAQVEIEYRDAKARLAAAEHSAAEWDQRAGIASLREQYEQAVEAIKATLRMVRVAPTTLAGAIALINCARRELMTGEVGWETTALRSAARALTRMNKEAA